MRHRELSAACLYLMTLRAIRQLTRDSCQAPGEAEAQCAELARAGKVYAAGSEDMDTLTFSTPILLRHLTFSEAKKMPISCIELKTALEDLNMTMDQVSLVYPIDHLHPD